MKAKHTAWTCASAIIPITLLAGAPSAVAQPTDFIDLGVRTTPETLVIPVQLRSERDVRWYRVELPGATPAAGFIDLWSEPPLTDATLSNHTVAVFDAAGERIAISWNVTEWNQPWLSFGITDPRPPVTMPYTGVQDPVPAPPFDGRDGVMTPGVYWVAVVRGVPFIGSTAWDVRAPITHSEQRDTILHIRIQPPDVPYCDADFNWDGNTDQDDVLYLANVIAGGENPTGRWADYNRDGNDDQDDLLALVHTIAGGGCPE